MNIATLEIFTSEMLHRTQFYKAIPENRKLVLQMLLKVIGICLERDDVRVAFKFLKNINQFIQPETDSYENVLFQYYKGLYAYLIGDKEGVERMIKCADVMIFLESYEMAQDMREKISHISKKSK